MKNYNYAYKIVDGWLFKKVESSKHFLRTPPAICFDYEIYMKNKDKIRGVKIFDKDTGKTYYVSNYFINEKGFFINRGFVKQIGVLLEFWNTGEEVKNLF